jgi:hypothetical protein
MGTKRARELPGRLEKLRRRFERWRGAHRARARIPDRLWNSAAMMAGTYGLNRTAKALRLDYYGLKRRVQPVGVAPADPPRGGAATFLELPAPPFAGPCECSLDLEDARGAKMRLHLKGIATPDLVALSRSFWNQQS